MRVEGGGPPTLPICVCCFYVLSCDSGAGVTPESWFSGVPPPSTLYVLLQPIHRHVGLSAQLTPWWATHTRAVPFLPGTNTRRHSFLCGVPTSEGDSDALVPSYQCRRWHWVPQYTA